MSHDRACSEAAPPHPIVARLAGARSIDRSLVAVAVAVAIKDGGPVTDRLEIAGYVLDRDRFYHPDTHVWVLQETTGTVRFGLDPLGLETMGTLAQLEFLPVGTIVERGEPLGTLEAEKFVGPLESPLSGTVRAINQDAVVDPRIVHDDPLAAWLVELDPAEYASEAALLIGGDEIEGWFTAKLAEYRLKGVLAE